MSGLRRTIPALLLGGLLLVPPARAEDAVFRAMHDELQRSVDQLQLEQAEKPYFVSYNVEDIGITRVAAGFGSLLASDENFQRWLWVEVRVGDYALDSSNFQPSVGFSGPFSAPLFSGANRVRLPIEDDYLEIRRQLWLATDRAYKRAVENLAKKRAVLQNRTRTEELPDFSHEPAITVEDAAQVPSIDRQAVDTLVRDLSSRFRKLPAVQDAQVEFQAAVTRTRYVNSEGTSFERTTPLLSFTAWAATQAANGLPLKDCVAFHARTMSEVPPADQLSAAIDGMGARLAALREASDLDLYNGPVLFEAQAAAELMAQVLFPALRARREPVSEHDMGASPDVSLKDKIGSHVLPRFLSVIDDPTQTSFRGAPLIGSYKVDDEGVATRPTRLIEHGVLKTLLAGRAPVTGVTHSTGNRRSGNILPSNVFVTADEPASREKLGQEMQKLVQERGTGFGIVVRRLGNPSYAEPGEVTFVFPPQEETRVEPLIEAYKVYPDGREELIRNVRISGISPAAFKDIVAASEEAAVYSAPFPPDGPPTYFMLGAGQPLQVVSWVVPSFLFEDLTLKKSSDEAPRPPIVPHPFFARDGGK